MLGFRFILGPLTTTTSILLASEEVRTLPAAQLSASLSELVTSLYASISCGHKFAYVIIIHMASPGNELVNHMASP